MCLVGLSPDKGALITINLDGFNGNKRAGDFQSSVKSLLKEYILSGFGKQWIYHPRFQRQQESCLESIKIKYGDEVEFNGVTYLSQEYKPSTENILDVCATLNGGSNKHAIFNCRNCGNEWQEREFGLNKCSKCDTHLYRSVIRYLC